MWRLLLTTIKICIKFSPSANSFVSNIIKTLSYKVLPALRSCSKCSFTPSKLRFFTLRKPKTPSCYTTSNKKKRLSQLDLLDNLFYLYLINYRRTTLCPKGISEYIINLKCCKPNGMPMIVMQKNTPNVR